MLFTQVDNDKYLRVNKTKGQYHDLDHYLDVQFRLLREDFVAPLREGISDYIQINQERAGGKQKQKDLRIYYNVKIVSPDAGDNGVCHVLQFDVSRMGRVKWHNTKRLIFGSLICLSPDNFRTFHFASVMNRKPKDLEKGIVVVRFEQDQHSVHELFGQTFVMAETMAYFESYRHVLTGLQNMRQGDLPFERYIIKSENRVLEPAYLRRRPDTVYDLRPLVDEKSVVKDTRLLGILLGDEDEENNIPQAFSDYSKPAENIKVLDRTSWPLGDLLHLDNSQFKAIHTALTKEFVITQGPPGTGKTYIGLKIVKALLHNRKVWSKDPVSGLTDHRPMLIVCYTNHALDQFLEGIVDFYKGDVLRVGARSKSEILQPYNLHNFRMRLRHERKIPVHVFQGRMGAKREMDETRYEIQKVSAEMQVASVNIMHEDFLRPFMGEQHFIMLTQQFQMMLQVYDAMYALQQGFPVIVEWLGLGNLAVIVEMEQNVEGPVQDQPNEEFIDVENEIDALQAERQLDDGEEDDIDFGLDDEFMEMTVKERLELRVDMARRTQERSVALNVDRIGNKPKDVAEGEWQYQKKERKKMKKKVQQNLSASEVMTDQEAATVQDMWRMTAQDKWRLYRYWINKYRDFLLAKIREKGEEYEGAAARYREALMQEDKEIMRHSAVLGMTTTGAARYQAILQEIKPRIIVVEEAAEVLEAHVITTLSKGCEHLILIGDHKQLKPNPTVYKLAKDYNLDVSLFERMVENGVQCDCLEFQHRMRPEIAELMKHIYKDLKNHVDVLKYENIKGMSSNMYFVNHSHPETHDDDLRSHSNDHEARYLVGLCRYLLLQGYKPEQITVLTLYSGQLFCLKNKMPKEEFEGVRLTVVDNFQGEESDIILLSLVRSNNNQSIGFLKSENRVCVALSRAKQAFYVIGNFDLLQSQSRLWNEIVIDMKQMKKLGEGLKLYCQNHPDDEPLVVKLPNDFAKAPEGGCQRKCGFRLNCGHSCEMYCHITDQDHKQYVCKKLCNKVICKNNHRCKSSCSKKCPPCQQTSEKVIPRCGHRQQVSCSVAPEDHDCMMECSQLLACKHKCQSKCGKAHTKECKVTVEKSWSCGHTAQVLCYQKDSAFCPISCDRVLSCEHSCQGTCGKCMQGRLHRKCQHECSRILVCGHECQDFCSQCPPCREKCANRCQHNACKKVCGELCVPCREPCTWVCKHHSCGNLCSEPCDRPMCNEPCPKRLKCGHRCIGLCGETCPTDCRVCDREKVTTIFFGDEDEPNARFVQMEDCKIRCIIEVNAMDRFMTSKPDEKGEIKMKECPKCKTPIRSTTRYRSIVNKILQDIEDVKEKVLTNKERLRDLEQKIKEGLIEIQSISLRVSLKKRLFSMIDPKSENALTALLNQVTFAKHISELKDDWTELKGIVYAGEKERANHNLEMFMDWVVQERSIMTEQETNDAQLEIERSRAHLRLLLYQKGAQERNTQLPEKLRQHIAKAEKLLAGVDRYDEKMKRIVEECLEVMKKLVPIGLTDDERVMVVKAMALPTGHWFKCKNGMFRFHYCFI